ncbi:MAG: cation:proton antiporter [Verrucomicrobiota bacterium]
MLQDIVIATLAISGTLFILLGGIGLARLPDVFCRGHALGKAMTLGISLLLFALWVERGVGGAGFKILLAIAFQFATIPVAAHLLTLLGYRRGVPRHSGKAVQPVEK